MENKAVYIGIDIGGSWLKGIAIPVDRCRCISNIATAILPQSVQKVESRLGEHADVAHFIEALDELLSLLLPSNEEVAGIGVSTAGVVNYGGQNILVAAPHLLALKSARWKAHLENRFNTKVTLINDADAVAIGASARGYLREDRTIGIMPIGTGVGFVVWRNGRRWTPHYSLPLLGSIMTPAGSYDSLAGTTVLSKHTGNAINQIFSTSVYAHVRKEYEQTLAQVIYSACVIYHINEILIGGGLANAICTSYYPLADILSVQVNKMLKPLGKQVTIKVMCEGNLLALAGALMLAAGENVASEAISRKKYDLINTELPYDPTLELQKMNAPELVKLLYAAEEEAGKNLCHSLADIAEASQAIAERLRNNGRLIYVGAGTSGRLAAIDTVELACTFGFPRQSVYALIAGGIADAAIDIESNFEEDASAVPELLLTDLRKEDVVIGISVSGSAYYVQSALALAGHIGAYTVFIQESNAEHVLCCNKVLQLRSGHEVIAGSTRMKAGTATKKVLNFLSTTTMILLGKVQGCHMTELECINQKLIERARRIEQTLKQQTKKK